MVTAKRSDHPTPDATGDGDKPKPGSTTPDPGPNPLEPVFQKLSELFEYASEYIAVRQDKLKAGLRRLIIKAVIALFAALVGLTALVVAVVLLMVGLAGWIGTLLGSEPAGGIVVGGGLCLIAAAALLVGLRQWGSSSRRKTISKYERRHAKQRARFSNDVIERAARRRESV
jgi:uncharacterized membrane protein